MHPVLAKTFGGLSPSYYFRQFIFGLALTGFFYFVSTQGKQSLDFATLSMMVANTLLYPYSRFVYESIVGFVLGSNVFFVNALLMLAAKMMTMFLCWILAMFVAPVGLIYLYFYHSKTT